MESSLDMVNAALGNDQESFMAAFNAALATKVSDAIEVRKVEIASTLLTPETEETNEVETTEIEFDGSDADDDTSDEIADDEETTAE
jgi:hypothetical protein